MEIEISTIEVACSRCSRKYTVEVPSVFKERLLTDPKAFTCDECYPTVVAEREKEREAEERLDRETRIDSLLEDAGVRPKYRLVAPPVRYVAEWIWSHRDHNILLSGETGTGKSTSCGVVVRSMIIESNADIHVHYLTELLDTWREVRADQKHPGRIRWFLDELEDSDVLVIDECADKNVNSQSTQEFMFRLLEDVANGRCKAKLWLVGNFYRGAVGDMFGDEAPAMRRIRENFVTGRINPELQAVVPII